MSSLNPYAASYIPLSKRDISENREALEISGNSSKSLDSGPREHSTENKQSGKASVDYNALGMGKLPFPEPYTQKSHLPHCSYGSSSKKRDEITDNWMLDVEFDMDLEYLQMTFPGISYESLADVYLVNKGDLEAAMLRQLESYTVPSDNLPHTLDIGDIAESKPSTASEYLKLKEVAGESSGLSSGTAELRDLT